MTSMFKDAIVLYSRLPGGAVTVTHSHTVTASKPQCALRSFGLMSSMHIQTATSGHPVRAHSRLKPPWCSVGPTTS